MTIATPTYTDFSGLNEMRAQARVDPQASLKKVAKQFEGIFIQMMMKSMRDASMGDAIFDSDQSKLYRDMFDKQIALDMANSRGIGIADSLVRQLGTKNTDQMEPESVNASLFQPKKMIRHGKMLPTRAVEQKTDAIEKSAINDLSKLELSKVKVRTEKTQFNSPEEFTDYILPYAEKAAKELGISPLVLVSQAALETGWGNAITRHQDGSSSYNLFNIKADKRWGGDQVGKSTLEYENGIAKYEKASFRSYDSYSDSFDDYVDFLRTNNRYSDALRNQGDDHLYIKDLHKAGYATDPNYANKIIDILKRDTMQVHAKANIDAVTGELNGG